MSTSAFMRNWRILCAIIAIYAYLMELMRICSGLCVSAKIYARFQQFLRY